MSIVSDTSYDYLQVERQFTLPSGNIGTRIPTMGSLMFNIGDSTVYESTGAVWKPINGLTTNLQQLVVNNLTVLDTLNPDVPINDLEVNNLTVLQSLHLNAGGTANTLINVQSAQTANRTVVLPDASGTIVLDMNPIALTNKIITDSSNNVSANALNDATGSVNVSESLAPSAGQVLIATDATHATWQNASLSGIGGTLPVNQGGTGDTTLTSGNVLVGAGTSAITTTKAAPAGAFVGTTDVQVLTNKTITDSTSTVYAKGLNTTGAAVVVSSAAPPSAGQVLTATSATVATWQNPSATTVATALADATGNVDVSAATAPTSGQVLTATDATHATWQTPSVTTTAAALQSATTVVNVSAASAPTSGQVLTATDGTHAIWQTPGNTNNAGNLLSNSTTINISAAAAPTAGQVLTATDSTHATWQTPASLSSVNDIEIVESLEVDVSAATQFDDTTDAVNDATGAIVCAGGIGAAKTVWAGTKLATGTSSALLLTAGGSAGTITTIQATQTSSRVINLPDASGTIDLTSNTATLFNKTITDSTNNVAANSLKTTSSPVSVVGAPPSSGMVLTAVSPTQASWQSSTSITSGVYTPTVIASYGVDHIAPHQYYVIGNQYVVVYGSITVSEGLDPAIPQALITIPLFRGTSFGSVDELIGSGSQFLPTTLPQRISAVYLYADVSTNSKAVLQLPTDSEGVMNPGPVYYSFMYTLS